VVCIVSSTPSSRRSARDIVASTAWESRTWTTIQDKPERVDRDEIKKRAAGERGGGWTPYLERVYDAGGWKGYAQAHRASLVAMLVPKLRLPADVIPLVVDFWAHVGMSLPPSPPPPHGRLLDDGSELLWGEEWRSVEEFRAACYEDFLLFLKRY